MATCPECDGVGKWQENGKKVYCKVCKGWGGLSDLQLAGYEARKTMELKLRLEEIADPSPENQRRIASLRGHLSNLQPKNHEASSWREWRDPKDEKIFQEAMRRGVDIDIVVKEWGGREKRKSELAFIGGASILFLVLGFLECVVIPRSPISTLTLVVSGFIGISFLWTLTGHHDPTF